MLNHKTERKAQVRILKVRFSIDIMHYYFKNHIYKHMTTGLDMLSTFTIDNTIKPHGKAQCNYPIQTKWSRHIHPKI